MEILIRKAEPTDAAQILSFLKQVGGESDNLTFGKEGLPFTEEQERNFIASTNGSTNNCIFVACDGNKIIADASLGGNNCARMKHQRTLGISVLKEYWGMGVGSMLLSKIIDFAKASGTEIITLEVRSDNHRAIKLYEKFGFKKIGRFDGFFKIGDDYIDFDYMNLYL